MIRFLPRITPAQRRRSIAAAAVALAVSSALIGSNASAYSLSGTTWPAGSRIVFQLGLGNSVKPLTDGSPSWNAAVAPVFNAWNQKLGRIQMASVVGTTGAASKGDGVNSIAWSPTVYGQSFGGSTLAVTVYLMRSSSTVEADVLFNPAMVFDSYTGPLKFPIGGGTAIADIQRVLLHELGHGIGLNHPDQAGQRVDAVMNSVISSRDTLAADDISGAQSMYGAPTTSTPLPTPTPTPTPTPVSTPPPSTPTPTPAAPSHLANISTRMQVGTAQNVSIAGFIVSGPQPKKLVLRAIGPSLSALGISGAMNDPMLELYDSAGTLIAQNDDWQSSAQASQIAATGIAPSSPAESAAIITVPAGSYTAVVSGWEGDQGVAVVEAYELDSNSTRMINISTRGRVASGEQAMIGGLIIQGSSAKKVIVRALGPSLGAGGIADALANPSLELRDGTGNLIASNDNWGSSAQAAEIVASGVPPSDPLESAIVANLAPGTYTAIVRGADNGTGVGLVEVFDLQ